MKMYSFLELPLALTALVSTALLGTVAGAPVDSTAIAPRAIAAGIQMWSGADFTGNFYHYSAPQIRFDTCCKHFPLCAKANSG